MIRGNWIWALTLIVLAGIRTVQLPSVAVAQSETVTGARAKTDICHTSGRGQARLLAVPASTLNAHILHGDFQPVIFFSDNDGDGFGDGEASVVACTAPVGFVNNSDDNCPFAFNPEQFDADRDGKGDACDVLVTGPSLGPAPAQKHTSSIAQLSSEQLLAVLQNNTDELQPWNVKVLAEPPRIIGTLPLPEANFLLSEEAGVIAPGESIEVFATLRPEGLEVGKYYTAFSFAVDNSNPVLEGLWENIQRPVDFCEYKIDLESARIDSTQSGLESFADRDILEVRIEAIANGDAVVFPGADPRDHFDLFPGRVEPIDQQITTVRVSANGSEQLQLTAQVTELDFPAEGDDFGSSSGVLALDCPGGLGTSQAGDILAELEARPFGGINGGVIVTFSAEFLP